MSVQNLANKNIVKSVSDKIWFKDPKILVAKDRVSEFFPNEDMTTIEKMNAIMRMTLYMGVLLTVLCRNYLYLYIPLIAAGITWAVYSVQKDAGDDGNVEAKEELYTTSKGILKTAPAKPEVTEPSVDNPFMNFNKITSDRDRPPAEVSYDNVEVKKQIESDFNTNLYRDVSDLYGKRNSQREFYTTPGAFSEAGVGDQTSFAKFCYGTLSSQKESGVCKTDPAYCTGNYVPSMYTATPVVNR
jgi:hypothetical protein